MHTKRPTNAYKEMLHAQLKKKNLGEWATGRERETYRGDRERERERERERPTERNGNDSELATKRPTSDETYI